MSDFCTPLHAGPWFLAPEAMQVGQGLLNHAIPWLIGLVFDTGTSVTPPIGQLGCLSSRWSVPVLEIFSHETCSEFGSARYNDLSHWPVLIDSQTTPQLLGE